MINPFRSFSRFCRASRPGDISSKFTDVVAFLGERGGLLLACMRPEGVEVSITPVDSNLEQYTQTANLPARTQQVQRLRACNKHNG